MQINRRIKRKTKKGRIRIYTSIEISVKIISFLSTYERYKECKQNAADSSTHTYIYTHIYIYTRSYFHLSEFQRRFALHYFLIGLLVAIFIQRNRRE